MCGRFVAAYDAERIARDWDARMSHTLPPASWNVAPNAPIRVLVPEKRGSLWLTVAHWSLIPEWMQPGEIPSFASRPRWTGQPTAIRPEITVSSCP